MDFAAAYSVAVDFEEAFAEVFAADGFVDCPVAVLFVVDYLIVVRKFLSPTASNKIV